MKQKIKNFIKKHPHFFIVYDDAGSWTIYPSTKSIDMEAGEEKEVGLSGDDFSGTNGYVSELTEALVELLGGSADSF